ncbi:pheromone-processing carboxypeptidase KEX1 [Cyathus striatus]|nr:pheromone-processing carboxypeptidase KEX1 [Cyathus striatus]
MLRYYAVLTLLLLMLLNWSGVDAAPTDANPVPSAASFYVPSIPDVYWDPNNPLMIYSGHLPADPNAARASSTDIISHLFFVLVKNRRVADKQRIVFWFNGGPGCSSFDGLMMEVGPWRWDGKHSFIAKEGGWEEYTTMVYVDQPAGTGFSYTSTNHYVKTIDDASQEFVTFLENFYKVFPEYKNMETYLAGESFAGQWIPYYADAVLNSKLQVPLRGAAIGNGWIDPKRHYPSYLDYAVKVGILEENSVAWKDAKKHTDDCIAVMDKITDLPMQYNECQSLLLDVVRVREKTVNGKDTCINIYDVRLDDEKPACGMNWPPDIKPITEFLGRRDVVRALHADAHPGSWTECRGDVHRAFEETKLNSSFNVLPKVLEKIEVLIFAGDQDLICNYVGLENMIKGLNWNGATGLGSWSVNGAPAGTWVSSRNLTYTKIFNASHMAPYDVPHVTHDMILRFMGVNFTALVDGSAKIPSSIGSVSKPIFIGGDEAKPTQSPAKTPEQDKAMWEAYYNAGSAALVLVLIFFGIGIFVWCRFRRRRVALPVRQEGEEEESIPLTQSVRENGDEEDRDEMRSRSLGKGKQRAMGESAEPIFEVGESDEDDEEWKKSRRGNM